MRLGRISKIARPDPNDIPERLLRVVFRRSAPRIAPYHGASGDFGHRGGLSPMPLRRSRSMIPTDHPVEPLIAETRVILQTETTAV